MATGFEKIGTVLSAYRHISDFFGRCDKFFTFAIHIRIDMDIHRAFLVKLIHEFFEQSPTFKVAVLFLELLTPSSDCLLPAVKVTAEKGHPYITSPPFHDRYIASLGRRTFLHSPRPLMLYLQIRKGLARIRTTPPCRCHPKYVVFDLSPHL